MTRSCWSATYRSAAAALAVVLIAGCESATAPARDTLHWTASIAGVGEPPGVSGAAAVVAAPESFEIELQLAALPAGTYSWELAAGTCAEPGGRIGAATSYPALTPEANGTVVATTEMIGILAAAAPYHVGIFQMVTGEDDAVIRVDVACGNLTRAS